ncbi:ATP-binding protein [Yoonia sp. SS1-5]|uniref:AAA family ATPase n=1 Tax=Yoonia rhodophyticola TaxID=3137370 RepID=A0AAN0ME13_9RHOB
MAQTHPVLHLLCGLIASGKSTLAAQLSAGPDTLLLSEDSWLKGLYVDELTSGADYLRYAARLRNVMGPHITTLLDMGISVVLDFPANTVGQRKWMREIIDDSGAAHQLHYLDTPAQVCLDRLRARNATGAHAFAATEAQFHQFAQHFAPPTADENFTIIRHTSS